MQSLSAVDAQSGYNVKLRLSNYSNPRQLRPFCGGGTCYSNLYYCCDGGTGIGVSCPTEGADLLENRCDTFFVYCLRNTNTTIGAGCSNSEERLLSNVSQNDASLNFSQSTVLGLENPLTFQGLTNYWNVNNDS